MLTKYCFYVINILVAAVYKEPDVHIYNGDKKLEFAILENGPRYTAKWNSEQLNKISLKKMIP